MKKLTIAFLLVLVSCGQNQVEIYGPDYKGQLDDINNRVTSLEERVDSLELSIANNINQISDLQVQIDENDGETANEVTALTSMIGILQTHVNTEVANLVTLVNDKTENVITEIIDPCGDGPGYDEVLIKTASGKIFAYFESGSSRFLSVIPTGYYRTTDSTGCYFTVTSTNTVTW